MEIVEYDKASNVVLHFVPKRLNLLCFTNLKLPVFAYGLIFTNMIELPSHRVIGVKSKPPGRSGPLACSCGRSAG